MGCDDANATERVRGGWISIHAPTWGATKANFGYSDDSEFQSTHPHGVRRWYYIDVDVRMIISIHAPTWGATCNR